METEVQQQYLSTLEEMILDEQRLVTYTTISKELCIHANSSKSLLHAVVDRIKKKEPEISLNINYIVCGLQENNRALTTVCSENEIDVVKSKFQSIFYDHIYSVSKGSPKVDNVALMLINKFEDFPLCMGLIKSSSCCKRSPSEIGKLKTHSQENKPAQPVKASSFPGLTKNKTVSKTIGETVETTKTTVEEVKKVKSESSIKVKSESSIKVKSEPSIKVKSDSNKTEIKSPTTDSKDSSTNKTKPDTMSKNQKGIAGFFGKQNGAANKTPIKKKQIPVETPDTVKVDVKEEKMEIDNESLEPEPKVKEVTSNGHNKKANEKKEKQQAKNKSVTQIKKTAKVDKKRKRVLAVSDSESDDDKDPFIDVDETPAVEQESEDEIPPTPTINTVKVTSAMVNPKKRRKIVDKTYTDDEGYILTKKVEVYESCSENEEEVAAKENVVVKTTAQVKKERSPKDKKESKISKKKISPPQKGKQATLMNFFKKV